MVPGHIVTSRGTPRTLAPPRKKAHSFAFSLRMRPVLSHTYVTYRGNRKGTFSLHKNGGSNGKCKASCLGLRPCIRHRNNRKSVIMLCPCRCRPGADRLIHLLGGKRCGIRLASTR